MNLIKKCLIELDLINVKNLEVFSRQTRDSKNITVMRDTQSGVIFLDDFVTDNKVYEDGEYRKEGSNLYGKRDYEIICDVRRRLKDYKQFYVGKKIIDFGCGEGTFLKEISADAEEICGIEIEKSYVSHLKSDQINCVLNIKEIPAGSIDTVFCFHTLEHLQRPIEILQEFKRVLGSRGQIIIEVPHANDFLLRYLKSDIFKNFTLWSQHLILHSRISLEKFLNVAGYNNITIQGKQRYPLSNHLHWLNHGKPGGHKSILSSIDTEDLSGAYERSLQMIDATDTLVAIATIDKSNKE